MIEFLRIVEIGARKLVGKRLLMSMRENKTAELWRSFMPRRNEVENRVNGDYISMQIYRDPSYFEYYKPKEKFEKWATVEVTDFNRIPNEMECFTIPAGLYAVFFYKGDWSGAAAAFEYIFGSWLPASLFVLDNRPHFEVLGARYSNRSPESEEEIWVPIK